MELEGSAIGCIDESMNKSFSKQEPSGKCRSRAAAAAPDVQQLATACFDCSICMDSAVDPVVTLCGHLYCWPCIYQWMRAEAASSPRNCPVCKAPLSLNALIPLYGRGSSINTNNLDIPNRPGTLRDTIASLIQEEQHSSRGNTDELINLHRPMQHQQPHHHHHRHQYYPSFSWTAGGVLGGLAIGILPLISRNNYRGEMHSSRSNQLNAYGNSAGQRRQEKRVEVWLHQLWVFLFCCVVLCLLFF